MEEERSRSTGSSRRSQLGTGFGIDGLAVNLLEQQISAGSCNCGYRARCMDIIRLGDQKVYEILEREKDCWGVVNICEIVVETFEAMKKSEVERRQSESVPGLGFGG
jgi:hypothetical protein